MNKWNKCDSCNSKVYSKDKDSHLNDYIVAIDAVSRPKNQYSTLTIMR